MQLSGIIPALITPLTADEQVDEAGLKQVIDHVIGGGVSGIFVLGSCGEGPTLPIEVQERVVRIANAHIRGRVKLLVGAFDTGTRNTIERGKRLLRCGGDAVVVVAPYYFAHNQDEIVAHFTHIAKAMPVPTVVYNIPSAVKSVLEPETVARLAEIKDIVAIKDSYGDMTRFQNLLLIKRKRADFGVFQGAEAVVAVSLIRGADGAVLGLANVAPRLCTDLFSNVKKGDLASAFADQERLMMLWKLHWHGSWLPCLKQAVHQLGLCGPTATAPWTPCNQAGIDGVLADLASAKISAGFSAEGK
jgi:4-hydroxy-tetrahydrodipicolinate synthase